MTPEQKKNRAAQKRRWRERNPERNAREKRGRAYRRRYGITIEDYERILIEQGGVCAICSIPPSPNGHRLHVDHDHTTGAVRALLCQRCNTAISYFEGPMRQAYIGYLARYKTPI